MRVRLGSARTTDSGTTSSQTTMTRRAARAASFWQPSRPHTWASPSAVARWVWMMATSGLSGGTANTVSSPKGLATGTMRGLTRGRSLCAYERSGKKGSAAAPAV